MANKHVALPVYGIEITFNPKNKGGGVISSDLHSHLVDAGDSEQMQAQCEAAADALESLILAHAVSGLDIASDSYVNGVKTAVEAIANNL